MEEKESSISIASRLLIITVLSVNLITFTGCVTNEDYSASVSEPTNGTFIQSVSFSDINEMDGARYELNYQYNSSISTNYNIKVYERKNGSYKSNLVETSHLVPRAELTHGDSLAPPWDRGEKRTYKIEVVRADTGTVIDSVTIAIKRNNG